MFLSQLGHSHQGRDSILRGLGPCAADRFSCAIGALEVGSVDAVKGPSLCSGEVGLQTGYLGGAVDCQGGVPGTGAAK